ncbi:MAG: hypothetical protein AB7T63_14105 [Planctomycetota bacterium]
MAVIGVSANLGEAGGEISVSDVADAIWMPSSSGVEDLIAYRCGSKFPHGMLLTALRPEPRVCMVNEAHVQQAELLAGGLRVRVRGDKKLVGLGPQEQIDLWAAMWAGCKDRLDARSLALEGRAGCRVLPRVVVEPDMLPRVSLEPTLLLDELLAGSRVGKFLGPEGWLLRWASLDGQGEFRLLLDAASGWPERLVEMDEAGTEHVLLERIGASDATVAWPIDWEALVLPEEAAILRSMYLAAEREVVLGEFMRLVLRHFAAEGRADWSRALRSASVALSIGLYPDERVRDVAKGLWEAPRMGRNAFEAQWMAASSSSKELRDFERARLLGSLAGDYWPTLLLELAPLTSTSEDVSDVDRDRLNAVHGCAMRNVQTRLMRALRDIANAAGRERSPAGDED